MVTMRLNMIRWLYGLISVAVAGVHVLPESGQREESGNHNHLLRLKKRNIPIPIASATPQKKR
jgi:hypothetical protein